MFKVHNLEHATQPGEISSRRWLESGNEILGPQGLGWEIPNTLSFLFQLAKSGQYGSPRKGYGGRISNWLRRLVSPPTLAQVQINKTIGDAARDRIAARESPALIEQFLKTGSGGVRVDVLKLGNRIVVFESKVGLTSLNKDTKRQLAQYRQLLQEGTADHAVWEFTRSPITGQVGPTGPLRKELERFGIEIRINP